MRLLQTECMNIHPFDEALHLEAAGSAQPDTWLGTTSPAYWNMVGPFGGTTAAIAVRAVMLHPLLLGEPIALTVNYAAALSAGAFEVTAKPVRTNRSTQHWSIEQRQTDPATGDSVVVTTATAVTAARRSSWSASESPMPVLDRATAGPRFAFANAEWTHRYDIRAARGGLPQNWDGAEAMGDDASLTQLWVRDEPPRPLDFASLAAMADAFYPRIWLRRPLQVPAGTVSITTYFHAGSAQLAQSGTAYLLGQAKAQAFKNGFFDQTAQLWNEDGHLVATSHQIVYYKS